MEYESMLHCGCSEDDVRALIDGDAGIGLRLSCVCAWNGHAGLVLIFVLIWVEVDVS
jgi:hypothetical protein